MPFPIRTSRSEFGPEPKQRRPVADPERELPARVGGLMFHQIAGSGLMVPLCWLRSDGANPPVILGRAEAWNPKQLTNGDFPAPTLTRTGAGLYTLTYAANYPDHEGISRPLNLQWAYAFVQQAGLGVATAYAFAANVVKIETYPLAAPGDAPFVVFAG